MDSYIGLRVLAGVASVGTMATCGVLSSVALGRLVDEVNLRLPADARFSPYGWHAAKYLRVQSEYRRIYPAGSLVRRLRLLGMIGVVGVTCAALAVGLAAGLAGWLLAGGCVVMWLMHHDWPAK